MRQSVLLSEQEISYLTPDELDQYEQLLQIEETLGSLLQYMLRVSSETKAYRHLVYLCVIIQALVEHRLYSDGPGPQAVKNTQNQYVHPVTGEKAIRFLQIDEPPGHGKSFTVSEHLPAWFLTNYPDRKVGLASYEADFAREWGGKAQQHIKDHPEYGVHVDKKKQAQDNWGIEGHKGGMFTAGVGGPITGKRFHLGIVDDPIKNQDEALSETMRRKSRNWWATSFITRSHPDGETVFILMATRWHEDDLSGQVTAESPEKWFRVSLPAIAFDTVDAEGFSVDEETGKRDPLNRKPGEALCPEMWPVDVLMDIKDGQGPLWFQAMFQGKPSIAAGNSFRNFANRYSLIDGIYTLKSEDGSVTTFKESDCYRLSTVDLAATEKETSDYSVFATGDITPDHRLLIRNIVRERITSDKHTDWFTGNYEKSKPRYVGVENKTYGLTLIQNIRRLGRYIVKSINTPGDKVSKAHPATEAMSGGLVYLPDEAEWLEPWIAEHKKFPNGSHDDQVDTTSMLVDEFNLVGPWTHVPVIEDRSIETRMQNHYDGLQDEIQDHDEIGFF